MNKPDKGPNSFLYFLDANKGKMAAALVASLTFNAYLWINQSRLQPKQIKYSGIFDDSILKTAREVTQHLMDSSYLTYFPYTLAFLSGDKLDPPLLRRLQQEGILPTSLEAIYAKSRELTEEKNVAAVRIDNAVVQNPTAQGLVPVEVSGVVAVRSNGSASQQDFHCRLTLGLRRRKVPEQHRKTNFRAYASPASQEEVEPVVADIQMDSQGQPAPMYPERRPD